MINKQEYEIKKKEQILKATLDLIKSEGFEGVTIRKIASVANVNVALINYHFGSKNKLINEVILILVDSMRESFVILDDDSVKPRERLKRFLLQYVDIYHQYPFIIRRLLSQEEIVFESHKEFVTFIKGIGLKKVQTTIEQLTGETNSEILINMMSHILGATLSLELIEPMYEQVTGFSLPDKETRIELFLNRYFPEIES